MAERFTLGERDWNDFAALLRQFRANGKRLTSGSHYEGHRENGDGRWHFGVTQSSVASGINTDATCATIDGPAGNGTNSTILPIDYSIEQMGFGERITVTIKNGKVYAFPFPYQ